MRLLLVLLITACNGSSPVPETGPAADAESHDAGLVDQVVTDFAPAVDDTVAPDTLDPADPCVAARQAVLAEMARINHCLMDGECASFMGQCPFGCYISHGKDESTATLMQLMAGYAAMTQCPQCSYGCAPPGTLSCQGGKCVMSYL